VGTLPQPPEIGNNPTVETFFNVVDTETLALFEHLSFDLLEEFDVFAPAETGRTRDHEPPCERAVGSRHSFYRISRGCATSVTSDLYAIERHAVKPATVFNIPK